MNAKTRSVLFVIPSLRGGGAERVIVTLLRHLDRSEYRPALAVVDMRGAVYRDEIPPDVEFIDLRCQRVRYALPGIIALVRKRRPDVVFSTLGHLNVALAIVRCVLPRGVRYIVRETTIVSCALQAYRHPRLWSLLYRRFYANHDLVVCQSRYMQVDLVAHYRIPLAMTTVINNPLDVERIRQLAAEPLEHSVADPGQITLVAAGRMSNEKGFDLLIRAIAQLCDARVQLLILGDGPLKEDLVRLAVVHGVAAQVHFVGFQANPYAWFSRADAFVLSSRYEGFPNVVLEALACGTPVIATPAPGGTREILDGIPECIASSAISAEAMAAAIRSWLTGPRTRVPSSVVERYAVKRIVAQYERVLA